jgi:hypothetical protein
MALLAVFAYCMFYKAGVCGTGEIVFRVGYFFFGVLLAIVGVFRNPYLQLLWGGGLAFAALVLTVALCLGAIPRSEVLRAIASVAAAVFGSYLLLLDIDVKNYRQNLRKNLTCQ